VIQVKRARDLAESTDGVRYLVDRLWPRGIAKAKLHLDGWLKDVAPSDELRRWFGHKPERWEEFKRRYSAELDANPESWRPMLVAAKKGGVTLLYAAHDVEHNNAVALMEYLAQKVDRS
jgi:uncharacterized protein YeaO (DUF488 family)